MTKKDRYGNTITLQQPRVDIDKCIGCGLCVTVGNETAPGNRDFGCPPDYDAIDMSAFDDVVQAVSREAIESGEVQPDVELEPDAAAT